MKKLNKDYVLFATMHDVKEDSYVSFERVALKEVSDLEAGNTKPLNAGDGFADYSVIEMRLKGLAGRILTIIDAAVPEGQQNKCIKDLIRGKIMDEYTFWGDVLFDQERLSEMATEAFEEGTMTQVTDEQILGA